MLLLQKIANTRSTKGLSVSVALPLPECRRVGASSRWKFMSTNLITDWKLSTRKFTQQVVQPLLAFFRPGQATVIQYIIVHISFDLVLETLNLNPDIPLLEAYLAVQFRLVIGWKQKHWHRRLISQKSSKFKTQWELKSGKNICNTS